MKTGQTHTKTIIVQEKDSDYCVISVSYVL